MTAELTDMSAFVVELGDDTKAARDRLDPSTAAVVATLFVQAHDAVGDPHECFRLMSIIREKVGP